MIRIAEIQHAVATHYGVTMEEIRGPERSQHIAMARHVAMYLSHRMTIKSLRQVGNSFGHRDHSTVHAAVQKVSGMRPRDPELDDSIRAVLALIPGARPKAAA
jgi:chromosomal replication initiator protein